MEPKARFGNRSAGFVWGFTAAWLSMLVAMTYVFYRDGAPDGYSTGFVLAVLLVFWSAGLGLLLFAASKPCFWVTVEDASKILATWRYPHRVVRKVIARDQVSRAGVVDSKDSEGDPYYIARVRTADGELLDIREGHSRSDCEQACVQFNDALFGSRTGA